MAKAKWRCGVSDLMIAGTSNLTDGPHEGLLRVKFANAAYG